MAQRELTAATAEWDPQLSTLRAALDPAELAKHIAPLACTRWRSRRVRVIRTRPLNWHRGSRYTFEITITTENGWHNLVGKVYGQDSFGVFDAMKRIWRAGLDAKSDFSIPEPLAYVPSLRLLLLEKVEGRSAKQVFLKGKPVERAEAAERCGLWLTRFQILSPSQGRITKVRKLLWKSERRLRHIAEAKVSFATKAAELFQRLQEVSGMLEADIRCAGHGDYACYQILFAGKRTVTCDWDGYDIADPCRDAARFVVALERLALKECGSVRGLDKAAQTFLKTCPMTAHPGFVTRLGFYRAVQYLQSAKRDVASRAPGCLERAEIMVDEGLRALDQNKGGGPACRN